MWGHLRFACLFYFIFAYVTLGHVAANNQSCVKKLSPHLKGVTLPTRCGKYIYIFFFFKCAGVSYKKVEGCLRQFPLKCCFLHDILDSGNCRLEVLFLSF